MKTDTYMESDKISNNLTMEKVGAIMMKQAIEGMLVVDATGTIVKVNPSLTQMFGYTKEEMVGKKVELLVPDAIKSKHVAYRDNYYEHPIDHPTGHKMELQGRRKDGSEFPVEISLNHFMAGEELMVMALVTNTTEKGHIIEQLRREKETAETYLDIAGTIFVVMDMNHTVTKVNKKGCEILGYKQEEIIGKNWFKQFLPSWEWRHVKSVYNQLLKDQSIVNKQMQNTILNSDEEERNILWNITLVRDNDNEVCGILSSGNDITELKQAQEKLIKLNMELEQIVENRTRTISERARIYNLIARNFPNGLITILDKNLDYVFIEGHELYLNEEKKEDLIGSNFIEKIGEDMRDEVREKLLEVFKGKDLSFDLKWGSKTYMYYAVGLHNSDDNIDLILMVTQNVTPLKKAEEEIQKSLEKEKTLNELKSRFVSMASHEFQTPLTTILNSAFLLSKLNDKGFNSERLEKNVERIKSSVFQLSNILNDFLSMDKLEEGKVQIHNSRFDLTEFSKDVVEEMEEIVKKGQHILYSHQGEKVDLCFDKNLLKNVYQNLLSNAIKYSPENSNTELETYLDKDKLAVKVRDHGIGIPEEDQPHLFERFFRAKNALNIEGTGLGLNITKKYIDIVNGEIDLESSAAEGTTITVKIPLHAENC